MHRTEGRELQARAQPSVTPISWKLREVPIPNTDRLGNPEHALPIFGDVDPFVADVLGALIDESEQELRLAALAPAGDERRRSAVAKGGRVKRQGPASEHRQV